MIRKGVERLLAKLFGRDHPVPARTSRSSAGDEVLMPRPGSQPALRGGGGEEPDPLGQQLDRMWERIALVCEELAGHKTLTAVAHAQLGTVTRETNDAAFAIVAQLRGIEDAARRILERLGEASASSTRCASAWRQQAEQGVQGLGIRLRERFAANQAQLNALNEQARALLELTKSAGELAHRSNILAINAAIEAAHAGPAAAGFKVIADELRALSNRSGEMAQVISTGIGNLVRDAASSMAEAGWRDEDTLSGLSRDIVEMTDRLGELVMQQQRMLAQAREDGDALAGNIMDVLSSIQFQDVTRQQLEGIGRALDILDEQHEMLSRWLAGEMPQDATPQSVKERLGQLQAGYVSHAQRHDHAQITGGAGPDSAPAIELF